ncbi:MAG TPA: M56 family metallopeptidase [Rhizomicrobium sp.]|jgi:beta-lactamase regulating signal transducer with metallopeptidase domain
MSTLFVQNLLLFAGEAFVTSAIVVALAWEASHLFRNRASLRHLVWAGAFAALLLLPLLVWIVPAQIHVNLPAQRAVAVAPIATSEVDVAPVATAAVAIPQPHVFHLDIETIAFGLLSLYLAGVCAIASCGLAAVFGLHTLKRGSRAHIFDDLPSGRYQVRLSKAPNGYGPITWGLFQPIILLPFNAHFWPRERLQAVLLHETAHIARHDSLSQLLSLVVCALYWPNPLVWMAARTLRDEAELAADDYVIASGVRPSSYAGELLQLASEFRSRQPALAGMPLFMAAPSALEARVKSVLAPTQLRSGVTTMEVLKIGGVAILATAALTIARPSLAQDAPPPPPPIESAQLPPPPPAAPAPLTAPTPLAAPAPLAAQAAIPPIPATPLVAPVVRAEIVRPMIKVRESTRTVHGHHIHRIWMDVDTRGATAEEMERMRPELERAEAEVRAAQPRLERAQAELQRQEAKLHELQDQMPQIQARIEAELAKVQPEIDRALAQSRIEQMKVSNRVDNAMKRVQVRIEMKRVRDRAHEDVPDNEAPDTN